MLPSKCCFGFSLIDGIHGIVVWDSLYALFVITTAANTLAYFADQEQAYKAFVDLCSSACLVTRAIIGWWSCFSSFNKLRIKKYFILRIVWDLVLLTVNGFVAGFGLMPMQSMVFNAFVLLLVDGYLNLVIYSFLYQYDRYMARFKIKIPQHIQRNSVIENSQSIQLAFENNPIQFIDRLQAPVDKQSISNENSSYNNDQAQIIQSPDHIGPSGLSLRNINTHDNFGLQNQIPNQENQDYVTQYFNERKKLNKPIRKGRKTNNSQTLQFQNNVKQIFQSIQCQIQQIADVNDQNYKHQLSDDDRDNQV